MSSASASASASAVLAERQSRILDDIKRIESRLARIAQTVTRLGNASAAAASNGKTASEKAATKPKGPKPPATAAAASSSAAAASDASSPAAASLPSAALLASLNDDDPSRWWVQSDSEIAAAATGVIPRLTALCAQRQIDRFRFYRVASDYYDRSLEERRDMLGLPSIVHLCKSVIMHNSRWEATDSSGRAYEGNPQFVIVIVSYAEKLQKEKLTRAMWERHLAATAALGDAARTTLGKKSFNLRLADEAQAVALTGFEHNGMTPIGLREQNLPMLFASSLLRLEGGSLALGGGEVDVKWRVSIPQFLKAFQPIVADIVG